MSYLHKPVIYLEAKDFTAKGKLKHFKDKKCIIMAQANYCGHCTSAKPHFQQFAEKHPEVICLTIQGDGENEDEKQLIKTILKIKPSFQGFPDYFLFENGNYVDKEIEGRSVQDIEKFTEN